MGLALHFFKVVGGHPVRSQFTCRKPPSILLLRRFLGRHVWANCSGGSPEYYWWNFFSFPTSWGGCAQCTCCERYHVEILTCIVSVRPREAASTKSPPPCWAACAWHSSYLDVICYDYTYFTNHHILAWDFDKDYEDAWALETAPRTPADAGVS